MLRTVSAHTSPVPCGPLDGDRAREVGQLGAAPTVAHALACARGRGWPILTAEPKRYAGYDVDTEQLP